MSSHMTTTSYPKLPSHKIDKALLMSSHPLSNSAASISDGVDAMPESKMAPTPTQSSSPSSSVSSPLPPSLSSLSSTSTSTSKRRGSSTSTSTSKSRPSQSIATVQVKGNRLSVQLPQNRSCKVKRYNVALDLPSSKGNDKSVEASITRVDLVDDGTTSEYCVGHCTVCLVRRCDCVFLPCGHIKTCIKCGSNLYLRRMKCPICRKVIKLRPYRVYM